VPVRIYAHLSWTTFARLPLIDLPVRAFLEKFLTAECRRQEARLLELGVVRDHVHVLLELPGTFNVPRLVQGLKGASARIANRDGIARRESLRWAAGYDLRSVGRRELDVVRDYVRKQATHHPGKEVVDERRRSDPCAEAPARPNARPEGRSNVAPSEGAP
jgi:putative transposase